MNPYPRRIRSHPSIDKLATERFLWYRWAEINSLTYIHIIDWQGKIESSETIPWGNIDNTEEEIKRFSQLSVCQSYKFYILDKIETSDNNLIPKLIRSLIRVCNLYSTILDSEKKSFIYNDVIYLLYKKHYNHPAPVLNLWNSLCGDSNESKINVLYTHVGKQEKESLLMLGYILNIAQTACFNFWGLWFKESEEDYLSFCPVTLALLKGNVEHIRLLLQYGFQQNPNRVIIYDAHYYYVHDSIYSWLKAPLEERNSSRSAIIAEVLLFLIQISKVRSKSRLKSLIKCFHLLWSVNTIPFVTESELVSEIYKRYQSPPRRHRFLSFPYTCKHFINIVAIYDIVKPQGTTDVIMPRSLQQFCKHVIRKSLARSYNLPQDIIKLPLPIKLQAFLHV